MARGCTHQTRAPGEGATSIGRLRFGADDKGLGFGAAGRTLLSLSNPSRLLPLVAGTFLGQLLNQEVHPDGWQGHAVAGKARLRRQTSSFAVGAIWDLNQLRRQ